MAAELDVETASTLREGDDDASSSPVFPPFPRDDDDDDEGGDDRRSVSLSIEGRTRDDGTDDAPRERTDEDGSFLKHFASSSGPPQIIILCAVLALALGSTIGVTPAVLSDRYARLNHGFDSDDPCSSFGRDDRPRECLEGSDDAQRSAAIANFVSNLLQFGTSSLVGSVSDARGRKGVLLVGIFLSLLGPLNLVLLQLIPTMSPAYYYAFSAVDGVVSWVTVGLSALSDVMPPQWRAPSFGLLLAGFSVGFAFAPLLALALSRLGVSMLSLALASGGFAYAACCVPETLPEEASREALSRSRSASSSGRTRCRRFCRAAMRPARELSILNRDRLFRLLSALAFFSGMSSAADQTLLIYYVEERMGFTDGDVAVMFLIIGILGLFVQGFALKALNDAIGERLVVVVAFLGGIVTNILYGIASTKAFIFIGAILSNLTWMSFPTISAIKSNNVDESEQGRIQGALYSLQSLASAVGPVTLRFIYDCTKDSVGPGTMFLFAAALYSIAACCALALPKDRANSSPRRRARRRGRRDEGREGPEDADAALGAPLL